MSASAGVAEGSPAASGNIWIRTPPMPSPLTPLASSAEKFPIPFRWHPEQFWEKTEQAWWSEIKTQGSAWLWPPPGVGTWTHPRILVALLQHPPPISASAIPLTMRPLAGHQLPFPRAGGGTIHPRIFPGVLPFSAGTPLCLFLWAFFPHSELPFPAHLSQGRPRPTLSTTHCQKKLLT